jgi:hypothetical protein
MQTYLQAKKLELHQTPVILHIAKEDGRGKIGSAVIRGGSLIWYPGYAQKGHRIRWSRLGELIENEVPKRKHRKLRGK